MWRPLLGPIFGCPCPNVMKKNQLLVSSFMVEKCGFSCGFLMIHGSVNCLNWCFTVENPSFPASSSWNSMVSPKSRCNWVTTTSPWPCDTGDVVSCVSNAIASSRDTHGRGGKTAAPGAGRIGRLEVNSCGKKKNEILQLRSWMLWFCWKKLSSLESLISCRWSSTTGENQWLSILITSYNPTVRPGFFNLYIPVLNHRLPVVKGVNLQPSF